MGSALVELRQGPEPWLPKHQISSASWLNAVEGFFAILTRRRLKRGVFKGVVDLQAAINRFVVDHNLQSKPFVCTHSVKAAEIRVTAANQ